MADGDLACTRAADRPTRGITTGSAGRGLITVTARRTPATAVDGLSLHRIEHDKAGWIDVDQQARGAGQSEPPSVEVVVVVRPGASNSVMLFIAPSISDTVLCSSTTARARRGGGALRRSLH